MALQRIILTVQDYEVESIIEDLENYSGLQRRAYHVEAPLTLVKSAA